MQLEKLKMKNIASFIFDFSTVRSFFTVVDLEKNISIPTNGRQNFKFSN